VGCSMMCDEHNLSLYSSQVQGQAVLAAPTHIARLTDVCTNRSTRGSCIASHTDVFQRSLIAHPHPTIHHPADHGTRLVSIVPEAYCTALFVNATWLSTSTC
jgi:hypothetical protein